MTSAGWYQDPWGHSGQVRYWDGQRWLDTQSPPPPPEALSPEGRWWPSDWSTWPCPRNIIAGEASYQAALQQLIGPPRDVGYLVPVTVTLVREPANRYDRNAVRGDVNGVTVGYLRRQIAAQMADALDQVVCPSFSVCGLIRGGSLTAPNLGCHIWLDRLSRMARPSSLTTSMERPVAAAPRRRPSPMRRGEGKGGRHRVRITPASHATAVVGVARLARRGRSRR